MTVPCLDGYDKWGIDAPFSQGYVQKRNNHTTPPSLLSGTPPFKGGETSTIHLSPFTFHLLPSAFAKLRRTRFTFIFLLLSFYFYLLPFIFYLLPFIFYLLPFIFYLLPFIFYLLPFIFYLLRILPTGYRFLLFSSTYAGVFW